MVIFVSLQLASRAADSWKITSRPFYSETATTSPLETVASPRTRQPVGYRPLSLMILLLKCQLSQGCRKPDLNIIFHGQLSAAKRQYSDHQSHFLTVEASLYLFHLITFWITAKSHAQWLSADLLYLFFLMLFTRIWPEVFQQMIIFFLSSLQWNKLCQKTVLVF